MTHTYEIKGMTCNGCVAKVKSELLKLGDILNADVQLQSPQATITMQKHIATNTLQEAVSKAGKFSISDISAVMHQGNAAEAQGSDSYYSIFLIFGYITGVSLLIQLVQGHFHLMGWMQYFMAGFFLVFSFFKLLNLKGFAEGYSSYDIVAKRINAYGFIYPFIELGLGISLLIGYYPLATNMVTLVLMSVSIVGVIESLVKKSPFQCACLGTIIKLPLSKVTLFEDLLMIAMSLATIIYVS